MSRMQAGHSPSQTVLFHKCASKWYLHYYMKVRPVAIYRNTVAATMGKAFQAAFNVIYVAKDCPTAAQLIDSTLYYYDNELERLQNEEGRHLVAEKEAFEYRGRLAKLVNRLHLQPPVPEHYIIEGVEQKPQVNDNSFMDLWGRFPSGQPFFWDNKVKINCAKKDIPRHIEEYMYSWQMLHYAWSLGQRLEEPVVNYYICLAIGAPTINIHVEELAVDPERLEMWEASATRAWQKIHETRLTLDTYLDYKGHLPVGGELASIVPQSPEHWDRWGKCEMFDPCMIYKGNLTGLEHKYIQLTKK